MCWHRYTAHGSCIVLDGCIMFTAAHPGFLDAVVANSVLDGLEHSDPDLGLLCQPVLAEKGARHRMKCPSWHYRCV